MEVQRLNSECISCLINKYLCRHSGKKDDAVQTEYMQRILGILSKVPKTMGAPEIVDEIQKVEKEFFDYVEDFSETKRYFNNMMMSLEPKLSEELVKAKDALYLAVCYAMTGNYIDFGAMKNVDVEKLNELLDDAVNIKVCEDEFNKLKSELLTAQKLVYLTDNCGEIVLDKQLISTIRDICPQLEVKVIVRGEPVLNDATMEDALQIGMDKIADVMHNGSAIAGTCLEQISDSAKAEIDSADIIIAKGQGNFETLRHCGKNIYYLFMCKCMMFAKRFGVPQYSPMLINDLRMEKV